jgi:hypothetical protein
MPRRPPKHESRSTGATGKAHSPGRAPDAGFVEDPQSGRMAEVRRIQPYQATKTYICPGCNQEIRAGTGHLVVIPLGDPGDRRHWHIPCWEHRENRRPTGR